MLVNRVAVLFVLPLLTGACGQADEPPWIEGLGYGRDETFQLERERGLPALEVQVDGRQARMVLDTGNTVGLLFSHAEAARLGLEVAGQQPLYRSDGSPMGVYRTYRVGTLDALGGSWTDPPAGESGEPHLPGLIGPRFLLGKRFTLDDEHARLAVSATPLPLPADPSLPLALVVSPRHPELILLRGSVNGRDVLVEVDTGKTRTVVDPVLAAELALPPVDRGYRIDEMRVGTRVFSIPSAKPVSLAGIDQGLPEPILLSIGADVLSRVVLSVDYPRRVALIE